MLSKPLVKLCLDSGAYSAWSHNKIINVRDYIKFVKQVEPYVWKYINLDVIPGSIDRVRNREEVEASAAASYINLQKMKDAGLRPLPVFHQGESFKWLDKMIVDGERYIGISTAKNQPNFVQERWLDKFFSVVTDKSGRPLVQVHGFGSAHVDLLRRLPWQSVDSAGWTLAAAYGKMYVPSYVKGKPDYSIRPVLVTISGNFQENKYSQFRQFDNYGPEQQEAVLRFLEEEVGCSLGQARYDAYWRYKAMAVYYRNLCAAITNVEFHPLHVQSHFDDDFKKYDPAERDRQTAAKHIQSKLTRAIKLKPLVFIFSTAYDKKQFEVLRSAGADYHLLSYYSIKNRSEAVEEYVTGRIRTRGPVGLRKSDQHFGNRRYRDLRARHLIERLMQDNAPIAEAAE